MRATSLIYNQEQAMRFKKVVAAFLKHTRIQAENDDRAETTLRFYQSRFKSITAEIGDKQWDKLTKKDIVDCLEIVGRNLSNTTRAHNVTAMTTLQNYAMDILELPRIFKKLEKPRPNRREFLPTEEQIDALLQNASLEFRMIHAGLASSAARPGEMCAARIEDVRWEKGDFGGIVLVKHKTARKTGRPRIIPFSERMRTIVKMAIGERTGGQIFRTENGRKWTPTYLSSVFRRYRVAAGLPKEYVLYCGRHKAVTEMLDNGVPIKIASEIAGHSSVVMTERYTHLKAETLGRYLDLKKPSDAIGATC